jgi:hypothetical protein
MKTSKQLDPMVSFLVANGLADLEVIAYKSAEMLEFSGPDLCINASQMRPVEPA